jgi:hypothetical protein
MILSERSQKVDDSEGGTVLRQEELWVGCPYCGEMIEILVDISLGEQQYIEDCSVCCAPILMSTQVDAAGQFSRIDLKRDDE